MKLARYQMGGTDSPVRIGLVQDHGLIDIGHHLPQALAPSADAMLALIDAYDRLRSDLTALASRPAEHDLAQAPAPATACGDLRRRI